MSKHTDESLSVSEIVITAAVATFLSRSDTVDLITRHESGIEKLADDQVSLCAKIRADMMRELTRIVADADTPIKTCRAKPERAVIGVGLLSAPETNVVAFVGASAHGLFKGQILFSALEEQWADGRIEIRPI